VRLSRALLVSSGEAAYWGRRRRTRQITDLPPGWVRRLVFAHCAEERQVTQLADLLFRSKRDLRQLTDRLAVIWMSEQVGDKNLFMPYLRNSPIREP
jgi:hypothetical protein